MRPTARARLRCRATAMLPPTRSSIAARAITDSHATASNSAVVGGLGRRAAGPRDYGRLRPRGSPVITASYWDVTATAASRGGAGRCSGVAGSHRLCEVLHGVERGCEWLSRYDSPWTFGATPVFRLAVRLWPPGRGTAADIHGEGRNDGPCQPVSRQRANAQPKTADNRTTSQGGARQKASRAKFSNASIKCLADVTAEIHTGS